MRLLVTSYDTHLKVIDESGEIERIYLPNSRGIADHDGRTWILTNDSLHRLDGHSELLGEMDGHDLAVHDGDLVYLATAHSAVRTRAGEVLWLPPHLDSPTVADECHPSGMCSRDGELAYVTCLGADYMWRDHPKSGVLWDVQMNKSVAEDLRLPHTPRWHAGALWFLQSGDSALCRLDADGVTVVATLHGWTRGIAFPDERTALVGVAPIRPDSGGQWDDAEIAAVDLVTGTWHVEHRLDSGQQIFDLAVI